MLFKVTLSVPRLGGAIVAFAVFLSNSRCEAGSVTPERLLNAAAEPHNWLMHNKTYDSHRYSPLAQINRDNVSQLKLLFSVPLGDVNGSGNYARARHGSPLVNDGFMYIVD